jgi:hypothetical protein
MFKHAEGGMVGGLAMNGAKFGPTLAFLSWIGWAKLYLKLRCLREIAVAQGRFE